MKLALLALVLAAATAAAQEGQFLTLERAPAAVFPDADRFDPSVVEATAELQQAMAARLGGVTLTSIDERYPIARAFRGEQLLGTAVVVEEVGKHRPITFVVGVRPDGSIQDVAVMAYREAYGGDVTQPRFLHQYQGKSPTDDVRPFSGVKNVAGATLSVDAASRAVREAQVLMVVLGESKQ